MTDARHPERWLSDRRFLRLSGDAYKLHSVLLMYSVSNRTDGLVDDADLSLVAGVDRGRVDELELAELIERRGTAWLLTEYQRTQTSRNELEALDALRRRDRDRKARKRAERKDSPDGPGDGPPDVSPGHQRTGQDRTETGQDQPEPWPDVAIAGHWRVSGDPV